MAGPATTCLLPRHRLSVTTRGNLIGYRRGDRPMMRTFRGDEADAPDPQLDPEQHRRRPGALCGPLSCNLPRREEAQTQQQSQQEPQRQALGNSSCGQRRAVRDGAWGTPALQDRGRARNAAADLASALGVPKPWTVQDQPSYAPLLLRRATGPSPLAEDAPLPSTRPYDPASGGGLACGGGGSETSCYGTRADGSDSTGEALLGSQYSVTQGGEGRTELVRGPQASLAVSTPRLSLSAAAAAILRLHEQQRQRHAALVPLRLMRAITGCHHWRQLRALLQEYGDCLNALHVTAALGKLTRMQLPPPPSPSPPRVPPSLPERGSPCLSLPAGGKLAPAGEVAEVQILLSHLEIALRRHIDVAWAGSGGLADPGGGSGSGGGRGSDCSGGGGVRPGHVNAITAGSAAWIADMACEASATAAEAELYGITPRLGPRQLATSLAALARMRSVGWPVAEDRALLGAAVALSGFWQLESFPSQELTTLVYSLAKLGHHPGRTWLEAACDAAAGAAAQRHMCARQLSTFLWALATLRHQPGEAFMTAWTKAAVRAMARFSAYDISQALWALATLHRARSPPPLAAAGATAAAELLLPCATAPALPHGLPEVFVRAALGRAKAVLRSAGGGRGDCVPQDVCNILWAVSQLQLGPPRAWVTVVASALLSAPDAAIASCRPADLAGLLWALARMLPASPPPRGEMLRVVRAAARLVGQCGEQDMSNIFWALGSMRFVPPPRVMHAFGLRLLQLCVQGAAGPQLLSTALWCCVRLHVPPRPALLRQLLAAAARSAPQFDPRSAPLLLYSLARLHHLGWLPAEACQPLEPARVRQQSPQSLQHHRGRSTIAWPAWPEVAESWQRDGQAKPRSGVRADGMSAAPPPPASLLPLDLGPFLDVALGGMAEVEAEVGRPRLALPVLLWSVARLGHQPDEGWTRAYLAHTFEVLPQLSLAEACLVVSALLRLGHLPPPLWLARMEQLMARSWGPAAGREAAELRREVHSLTRRTAAAAAGAVEATDAAAPWVPAVGPAGPGPPTADGAFAEALSQGKVPKPAAVMVRREQQREFWQQRERQRRRQREVAARVLGQRLAACRARLAQLSSCMTRLRRGLAVLGAQVRQRQEGQQKGQQVRQCESQQPQAAAGASDGSAVDVAGGAA
ncbi:hypothetical protein PLESTM_002002400 [Pleodorina starrii]|nr:hypothetical protein PLESTM_002002400 [Pleodorina starrii]